MKFFASLKGKLKLSPNQARICYEMPSRYKDCFFLANASLFDSVNWYLHKGYETVFPHLVEKLMEISEFDQQQASKRISNIIEVLDQCDNLIDKRYTIRKDDSTFDLIRTFNMNHGAFSGHSLKIGGLRISPDVTRDEMKGLSVLSTHRLSTMDIKANGSFGGVKIDPKTYSSMEIEDILRKYKLYHMKDKDCLLEPDLNFGKRWNKCLNEKQELYSECDDEWLEIACSQGALFGLNFFLTNDQILSKLGFSSGINGKTFILQGLGKMGSRLALYLEALGAKCVGLKENDSHIFNKDGIDVHEAISYKEEYGTLIGFQLAKPADDFEIYKQDCDVLILAAKQKSLVCHMAKFIKAKLIVEAAYMPITPTAYMILLGHSKIILPDIFICGGSGVALYLRYLQKRSDITKSRIAPFYQHVLDDSVGKNPQVVSENNVTLIEKAGMQQNISTHAMQNIFNRKARNIHSKISSYQKNVIVERLYMNVYDVMHPVEINVTEILKSMRHLMEVQDGCFVPERTRQFHHVHLSEATISISKHLLCPQMKN